MKDDPELVLSRNRIIWCGL